MVADVPALLDRIEVYCDAAPRISARAEDLGPFVLFVPRGVGWPYYARPRHGAGRPVPADVEAVRARQRELKVAQAFEWIAEIAPWMRPVAEAAGLRVREHPLMVLTRRDLRAISAPDGVVLRLASLDDDLAAFGAVAALAFSSPGTAVGAPGLVEARRHPRSEAMATFVRDRMRRGVMISAAAFVDGEPVAVGCHQPVKDVTEVAGVGALPAFRRRGIATALTRLLADDALRRGIGTIFLSAADPDVARLYGRFGFEQVGTSCTAAPPSEDEGEG